MKQKSLPHVTKKIRRLEKEYESIPPEAFLKKACIEKKMRKLLIIEKEWLGYNAQKKRRPKKGDEKHDNI